MDRLQSLWLQIRLSRWFVRLPPELQEPPGLYLLAAGFGLLLALGVFGIYRFFLLRHIRGTGERAERQQLQSEIHRCRREGDFLGVGQRLETLGKVRAALEAYRQAEAFREAANLLLREGQRQKAKDLAQEGKVWDLYAQMAEEDGEPGEAAAAFERAGRPHAAARCYEAAGLADLAARAYQEAGMEHRAIELLTSERGRSTAETLDAALRAGLTTGPTSPEDERALRHTVQLWLEEGEPEKAFALAVDSGNLGLAVPIARDHLPPSTESADTCRRAGAYLAAAEIYHRLDDRRNEALARAEHHERLEQPEEAARWYESAEEWLPAAEHRATLGQTARAAELYARAGDRRQAAELFALSGQVDRQRDMLNQVAELESRIAELTGEAPSGTPASGTSNSDDQPTRVVFPGEPGNAAGQRYELGEELGRGGMGVVYRARDRMLERQVAYKVLPGLSPERPEAGKALLAEARAAARLSHPNIVQVHDAGYRDDSFFLVMELVEGGNLAHRIEQGPLSLPQVLRFGLQICAALDHAHQKRLIHRDLKPSNLLLTREEQLKLTDFGLARLFDETSKQVHTRPAGTPLYMAPEQLRGGPVDTRTDLYALGCVLFEMLCRRGPYTDGSILASLESPAIDPRELRPETPEVLAEIVLRCLSKTPDKRPASAREVGRFLASLG